MTVLLLPEIKRILTYIHSFRKIHITSDRHSKYTYCGKKITRYSHRYRLCTWHPYVKFYYSTKLCPSCRSIDLLKNTYKNK